LARILLGLPLGHTELVQPAGMVNLLGAPGFSGAYRLDKLNDISKLPGIYVHLYAKEESKPMRKMGHVSILAPTLEEVIEKASYVREHLIFVKD
jgi:5-(carboxyamino)imidazole ribonucleotide synthase